MVVAACVASIQSMKYHCIVFRVFCVQISVLITNGRSDDQVDAAARAVADNGISLFAVGECGSCYCEFLRHAQFLSELHWVICRVYS